MTTVNVCQEFVNSEENIREFLRDLHQCIHRAATCITVQENMVSSAVSLLQKYLSRVPFNGKECTIRTFVRTSAVSCYWIVEKWNDEKDISAKCLSTITDCSYIQIVHRELQILIELDHNICSFMPGLHPLSPEYKNELKPVMEELKKRFITCG